MNRSDIQRLQAVRGFPAVTIYAPTHRSYPDNQQDPVRVRNLVKEAKERLAMEAEKPIANALGEALDEVVETIDFEHTLDGLGIFVGDNVSAVHLMPFRTEAQVVVDETFATRNLVHALNRSPRYRVLSLSEKPTRLYEGMHTYLEEVTDHRFPLVNEGPDGAGPVKGTPHGNSALRDERHRAFFREVSRRVSELHAMEPLPIVLVGIERYQAFFREVAANTPHGDAIVATVTGSHDKTPAHELGQKVWPTVVEWIESRKAARLTELEQAVGAGRSASGLQQVWRAAKENRGAVLLVEEDYAEPAQASDDGMSISASSGTGGAADLDDAVDEVVEIVYSLGGEVAFVEPGRLQEHQKIALILRY
jgi:hypothetical protein